MAFQGTATKNEASFLFEVGVNYLLANGAMPLLTGNRDQDGFPIVSAAPEQTQ